VKKKQTRRWEIAQKGEETLPVVRQGRELLTDSLLNKGTAFSMEERDKLNIRGLVPPRCVDMETQAHRIMNKYNWKTSPLEKFIYLSSLQDRNENLFYKVLMENLIEMTPIVYTPVVGQACQQFGHIYRRPRGMYFSTADRGKFREMMDNWPRNNVDIIVVTDGSRILGLGDLGTNGMGIPIGKLSLYIAGAGIYPSRTLPVLLDVGTNNENLLNEPLYLGANHNRLTGDEFYELVDEFVQAAKDRWPMALIQFEDFTNDHAFPLLEKYRDNTLCFNDDIQGTGAVILSGVIGAMRILKNKLAEQKVVFYGAGSAGIGVADMIVAGMMEEGNLTAEEARKNFWFIDSKGLVTHKRDGDLAEHKIPYARNDEFLPTLLDVVKSVKPTILMGLSGQPQTFTKEIIKEMQKHTERPVIFSLSNPTSKSECTAEQVYKWTNGNAIFVSGSPFDKVEFDGKIYIPGQGNNMYIFPGVGLGASACQATKVTDSMFYAAAKTLAHMVTDSEFETGTVYPDLTKIREISASIASAVCRTAYAEGLAQLPIPDDIMSFIQSKMYHPDYPKYVLDEED